MAEPVKKLTNDTKPAHVLPVSRRDYSQIYDRIITDSRQKPVNYIKRWTVEGGAE